MGSLTMPETIANIFGNASVLDGIGDSLSGALLDRGSPIKLGVGQSLFLEGDEAGGFYIVKTGGLKATRLSPEGGEQLLAVFSPGDSIGEMAMFDDSPRSASITALREAVLIHWSKAAFFCFADENSALYRQLLGVMAKRLRDTNDALAARDFLPLAGQLARMMLRLGAGFGVTLPDDTVRIEHKLTQAELAAMIGASRENVSRVLNDWKRKGIIAREEGRYRLIDMDALEDMSVG
jgi:CRP-like cAMP-binding protein